MNESNSEHGLTPAEGSQPRLTVIIVNHESWPDVLQLTRGLTAQPEFRSGSCRVLVVDNASRQPAPLRWPDPRPACV